METLYADMTVSMSEFKKNPAEVLRRSNHKPVAVLNHNRAAFYMVEPQLFQAMVDELAQARPDTGATPAAPETEPAYRAVLARLGARLGALLGGGKPPAV
jgi:PHD/YefM family antitoxin component YafN of YafNO toxin-antitoxin module